MKSFNKRNITSIHNRPLFISCMVFVFSDIIFLLSGKLPLNIILLILALCIITALFFIKNMRTVLCLCLPVAITLITVNFFFFPKIPASERYDNKSGKIEGTITEKVSISDSYSSYRINITSLNGKKVDFKAVYTLNNNIGFSERESFTDWVSFSKTLDETSSFSNKMSAFSRVTFLKAKSVTNFPEKLYDDKTNAYKLFADLRQKWAEIIDLYIEDSEIGGIVKGVLLGDKSSVSQETYKHFSNLGLSHILAISGLHLSIIIALFDKFMMFFHFPRTVRCFFDIALIVFYSYLTGLSPSVLRAGIMMILFCVSYLFFEEYDSLTSLSVALCIITLFSPTAVFDLRLILSFTSTAGIIVLGLPASYGFTDAHGHFYLGFIKNTDFFMRHKVIIRRIIFKLNRPINAFVTSILFTVSAITFSFVPVMFFFGKISYFSIQGNLLFSVPLTLLLTFSPFIIIFSFCPKIAYFFGAIATKCGSNILYLLKKCSDKPKTVFLTYNFIPYLAAVCFLLFFVMFLVGIKKRRYYFAVVTVFITCLFCGIYYSSACDKNTMYVSYNSNSSEKIIFVKQNNTAICVNLGNISYYSSNLCDNSAEQLRTSDIDMFISPRAVSSDINDIKSLYENLFINSISFPKSDNGEIKDYITKQNTLYDVRDFSISESNDFQAFYTDDLDIKIFCNTNGKIKKTTPLFVLFSSELGKIAYTEQGFISNTYGYEKVKNEISDCDVLIIGDKYYSSYPEVTIDYYFDGDVIFLNSKVMKKILFENNNLNISCNEDESFTLTLPLRKVEK